VGKKQSAPKNFYTATEAIERLGMKRNTFFTYVREGKIKKITPPGHKEGYYPKTEIDKMARIRELAILEYAAEPSTFTRATEEDLRGIHDLSVSLFGIINSTSYETMLSWYRKNPQTYYVTKQEGIVTGYIGFLHINPETTERIMAVVEPGRPSPTETEILPFITGTPIEGLWVGLGVLPGLSELQARQQGMHLINGAIDVLEGLARKGMPVKKLYATSQTTSGIRLSRKLGFEEISSPGEPLIRFELDLEKSTSPLLKKYREIVKGAN
jgi:hypothetical protein